MICPICQGVVPEHHIEFAQMDQGQPILRLSCTSCGMGAFVTANGDLHYTPENLRKVV